MREYLTTHEECERCGGIRSGDSEEDSDEFSVTESECIDNIIKELTETLESINNSVNIKIKQITF